MESAYPKPINGCEILDRTEALMQGYDCGYPDHAFYRKCNNCPHRAKETPWLGDTVTNAAGARTASPWKKSI